MKGVLKGILVFFMVMAVSPVFAQEQRSFKTGKCSKQGMMMHTVMSKEMVGTEDGGVIVLIGNKLLKYDKNLDLKKEVEIQIDMKAMKKMMMQMREECPGMMRQTK